MNSYTVCKQKAKRIMLRDTRGNFYMNVLLPNKDYKPKRNDCAQKQAKSLSEPRNNKEENKFRVRKWKEDNPDKYKAHLEWVRQWRKKNRKKLLEYNQKWRDAHREEYRKQQREYARRKAAKKKELVNSSTKKERKTPNSRRKMVSK